ncbi:MAG: helix-turn-helix domain-containing protein [Patiriisocius sp.]|uniref:helix-turn-helix domain-containing protein n=1 Tax=Patiriisocius sp. TaxID=2822396 RepID=UPI003EF4E1A7
MSQKANKIISRLKSQLNLTKDKDLCLLLDIKHNTLSSWRKRDSLDFNKIIALCEENNLDLNYIFFEDDEDDEEVEKRDDKKDNMFVADTIDVSVTKKELNVLLSTKLTSKNRNISVFYNSDLKGDCLDKNTIFLGQAVSTKKISLKNTYVFKNEQDYYLDTVADILNTTKDGLIFKLKQNAVLLSEKNIKGGVWEILERK